MAEKTRVLIVASNPKGTRPIRVLEEIRSIKERLRQAKLDFEVATLPAPRQEDLRWTLLNEPVEIVHFCGHGTGAAGLVFEDKGGEVHVVDGPTLADFFSSFTEHLRCVVLNACYSDHQARVISEHVDYVVGTRHKITDEDTVQYSSAFYDALGAGREVKDAHHLGCNAMRWNHPEGEEEPSLRVRPGASWRPGGARGAAVEPAAEEASVVDGECPWDVFLTCNEEDKQAVMGIGLRLKQRMIKPWLDDWELAPGRVASQEKEKMLARCRTVAIFVGASGMAPWQEMEYFTALGEYVRRGRPVIPVLLPTAGEAPVLPLFLQQFQWVRFQSLDDREALARLEWGITGRRPASLS